MESRSSSTTGARSAIVLFGKVRLRIQEQAVRMEGMTGYRRSLRAYATRLDSSNLRIHQKESAVDDRPPSPVVTIVFGRFGRSLTATTASAEFIEPCAIATHSSVHKGRSQVSGRHALITAHKHQCGEDERTRRLRRSGGQFGFDNIHVPSAQHTPTSVHTLSRTEQIE